MKYLLVALLMAGSPVFAEADGPDAWRVQHVEQGDQLNYRAGPSTDYPVLGQLDYDARGLQTDLCVPTIAFAQYDQLDKSQQDAIGELPRWCVVRQNGERLGWVNAYYLAEDGA